MLSDIAAEVLEEKMANEKTKREGETVGKTNRVKDMLILRPSDIDIHNLMEI